MASSGGVVAVALALGAAGAALSLSACTDPAKDDYRAYKGKLGDLPEQLGSTGDTLATWRAAPDAVAQTTTMLSAANACIAALPTVDKWVKATDGDWHEDGAMGPLAKLGIALLDLKEGMRGCDELSRVSTPFPGNPACARACDDAWPKLVTAANAVADDAKKHGVTLSRMKELPAKN